MSISYTADQLQKKFQGAPGASGFARIAETLREEGRHEEAVALCQEGLRQKPQNLTGRLVLGKCLLDMDRLEEAREQLEAALRQDPRCLSAMHLLARIMSKLQWGEAAAAYYRSILELEPWDSETLARFRELSPAGAAGLAPATEPAGAAGPAVPPVTTLEALAAAAPSGPDVEEFDLNKVTDFPSDESTPSDLAGALEEVSLEDALSAPAPEPRAFAPAPPMSASEEPKPLDILPEAAPALDPVADEPAPISGDDVGDRLDSLFGVEDDKPLVASAPPSAEPIDPELADATLQLRALRDQEPPHATGAGEAATLPGPAADYSPMPAEAAAAETMGEAAPAPGEDVARPDAGFREDLSSPTETSVFAGGDLLPPEERVSGEDIEARLDDLFSLHDTTTRPVMKAIPDEARAEDPAPPAPEAVATWSGASPTDAAPEEEPAAEAPAVDAENQDLELPVPAGEDVFLAGGAEGPAPALPEGDVVTGQDVADKLEALFGEEPPRREEAPAPDPIASGSASWAAARPAAEEADAADGAATGAMESAAPVRDGDMPPAWGEGLESSRPPAQDPMTTESMLPRGPGLGQSPPITGEDIEDRLDSLFDIADEGSRTGALPRVETPVGDSLAAFPAPDAEPEASAVPEEVTSEEPQAPAPAGLFPAEGEGEAARTLMMPAAKESPSDWLARQADGPDAGDRSAETPREPGTAQPGAGDTLFIRNEDVFAEEPASARGPGAGGAVGPEMVEGEDIAERLDRIFAAEGPDPRGEDWPAAAAKAAAEAAIASGEAAADGMPALAEPEAMVPLEEPALPAAAGSGSLETGEIPLDEVALFAQDPAAALPGAEAGIPEESVAWGNPEETVISGDDVKARLSELFEAPSDRAIRPMEDEEPETPHFLANPEALPDGGAAAGAEADAAGAGTDDLLPPAPFAQTPSGDMGTRAPETGKNPAPSLAPLLDEEEGSLEEEENAPQSAAGANVATVTLAEIYFQQGLREQALQIYRQLLEREPGNDSVRKRIQEIEASKPEAGTGPGSDPRRPRPGLKVPKRKK